VCDFLLPPHLSLLLELHHEYLTKITWSTSHHLSFARLVIETLKPLPQDRKCFRMINGVLVERTVQEVMPALVTNSDGLKKVLDDLVKQYKRQQEDMEKWKVRVWACAFDVVLILLLELGLPTWDLGILLTPWCHSRRSTTFKWCKNERTARAHYLWLHERQLPNDMFVLDKLKIVTSSGRTTFVVWFEVVTELH
jgi:hypothetical protein